jgi:hypothetical protein
MNICICDGEACGHYCNSDEGFLNVKDIDERITVDNGESMKLEASNAMLFNLTFLVLMPHSKKSSMFQSCG